MLVDPNSPDAKIFKDFEVYAKFICEKYNISVELDSVKAETDENTIYLPSIMNMSSEELEMMYGILLHESGHIRYSSFKIEDFENIKTESRAFMSNAIEDARIENLLLKDFDGAKSIFEDLYCNHLSNKNLMKKVFKHSGNKPDLFSSLCFYMHNNLVKFKTPNFADIVGTINAAKIETFAIENNLDMLLKAKLDTWSDVVELTNKVCDLFFKKTQDKSKKISIKDDEKNKAKAESLLNDLKNKTQEFAKQIDVSKKIIDDLNQELQAFNKVHGAEIERLNNSIDEIEALKYEALDTIIDILPALKDGDSSCELRMPAHENV